MFVCKKIISRLKECFPFQRLMFCFLNFRRVTASRPHRRKAPASAPASPARPASSETKRCPRPVRGSALLLFQTSVQLLCNAEAAVDDLGASADDAADCPGAKTDSACSRGRPRRWAPSGTVRACRARYPSTSGPRRMPCSTYSISPLQAIGMICACSSYCALSRWNFSSCTVIAVASIRILPPG